MSKREEREIETIDSIKVSHPYSYYEYQLTNKHAIGKYSSSIEN